MIKSKYLENLIDAITILPGVGRKSAQRMAYQLLNTNPEKSLYLSQELKNIDTKISKYVSLLKSNRKHGKLLTGDVTPAYCARSENV